MRHIVPKKQREEQKSEIFVLGFGPTGLKVAKDIRALGHKLLIIDLNQEAIKRAAELDIECSVGDAQYYEVLKQFGLSKAKLVVITIPSKTAAMRALQNVKLLCPSATTIIRARYQIHSQAFLDNGANIVIGDEEASADKLSEIAIQKIAGIY